VLWDNTSINRMDKIGSGHLCMRKENLGFENNASYALNLILFINIADMMTISVFRS
jgi:NhaP-type Na+/H+ or K+/H+ antiporter